MKTSEYHKLPALTTFHSPPSSTSTVVSIFYFTIVQAVKQLPVIDWETLVNGISPPKIVFTFILSSFVSQCKTFRLPSYNISNGILMCNKPIIFPSRSRWWSPNLASIKCSLLFTYHKNAILFGCIRMN